MLFDSGSRFKRLIQRNDHFTDQRSAETKRLGDDRLHLRIMLDPAVSNAESIRDALELRKTEIKAVYADPDQRCPVENVVLRLADAVIASVIDQEDLDRHFMTGDRLQFLQIHHDRSVSRCTDHIVLIIRRIMLMDTAPLRVPHAGCLLLADGMRLILYQALVMVLSPIIIDGISFAGNTVAGHAGTDRRRKVIPHTGNGILRNKT